MSAVRRNDRRTTRNSLASPYARPAKSNTTSNPSQKKKSLWSFTGLLSYLNPLRFGSNGASSGRTERDRSESPSSDDEVRAQADTDDGHPSLFRPQLPEHPGNPDLVLGLPFGPQDNHLLPVCYIHELSSFSLSRIGRYQLMTQSLNSRIPHHKLPHDSLCHFR
ncbi:hypothetical protein BJ138DRAFT_35123 [Hygrophoropsis aurantiaca]|uniref:Uncharacterized protein n=1 Tax=Hygrophoropsis aurantiaca TaxID=72124 RepID=A0ACB8AE21_9AGAM|nr:hypothetical protein BJ138DRAFT_35123 [Hygrophoropsis aurantiaca]